MVLARNEAARIAACLGSAAGLDVLVLSMGSTDDTVGVAEALGARVVEVPFVEEFDRRCTLLSERKRVGMIWRKYVKIVGWVWFLIGLYAAADSFDEAVAYSQGSEGTTMSDRMRFFGPEDAARLAWGLGSMVIGATLVLIGR